MIFGAIEGSVICPGCEQPVFLDGLWETAHCDRCSNEIELGKEFWKNYLPDFLKDIRGYKEKQGSTCQTMGGLRTSWKYYRLKPRCTFCNTYYDFDFASKEPPYFLQCGNCKRKSPVTGRPKWLQRTLPAIKLLINSDFEETSEGFENLSEPVVFSCPKCGASLNINGAERLVPCEYCRVKVYLPDNLWFKLHPAKTKTMWFIGFESKELKKSKD